MEPPDADARLDQGLQRAFALLAADWGVDARDLRVRSAPIAAEERFEHADEARLVERAVTSRRREFATARRLAHELLAELGCTPAPLLPGPNRAPLWPAGTVGSISHARGIAAVALARRPPFDAIGLDIEGAEALGPETIDAVLTPGETARFAGLDGALGAWAKLAFCAKECAYKTWSQDLAAVPEFGDVEIDFEPALATFTARLIPRAGQPFDARTLRGRYASCGERVFAAALQIRV